MLMGALTRMSQAFVEKNFTIKRRVENYCRMSATNKEMQRHVRNDHHLDCNSTDQDQQTVTISRNSKYQCQ